MTGRHHRGTMCCPLCGYDVSVGRMIEAKDQDGYTYFICDECSKKKK